MNQTQLTIILLLLYAFLLNGKMTSQTVRDNSEYGSLRIACWNSRGSLASIPYIKDLLSQFDILALCEHWVFENRLYKLGQ